MRRFSRCVMVAAVVLCNVSWSWSVPPPGRSEAPSTALVREASRYISANRLMGLVTNYGGLFRDFDGVFGYNYGSFYPYTSIEDILSGHNTTSTIYGAGLWMGGKVNGEVRVAVAEYTCEYCPGPMALGSYQPDNPDFRVYKIYSDSLATNPNQDYLTWPVAQGAPLDGTGHPLCKGDQTLWAVYNDANPSQHTNNAGTTFPLGVEVHQLVYASDGPYYENQAVYIQYKLYNKGANSISDFYISYWIDPDLGGSTDDLVGCDTLGGIGFCYNGEANDAQFGSLPPAAGVRVLGGPVVPSPGDTAIFDGHSMPGYRNLRMTAFSKYINGTDPRDEMQTYNFMRGLQIDGSAYTYNGHTLKFMTSGDPIAGTGDLDVRPADRRMMLSFGPLTFNPGDSQQVFLKVASGRGSDRLSSIGVLQYNLMSGPVSQCNSANLTVKDYGQITGSEFVPAAGKWLTGVNWGGRTSDGGIGYGRDFLGSSLDPSTMPDSFVNVEIRFSNTVQQKAYQYVHPGYSYGGYYPVPFTVWDTDHGQQLNAAFVEWADSRTFNSTWDLDDSANSGGREYLIIFKSPYSGDNPFAAPLHYPLRNLRDEAGSLDLLYAGWFCLATGHTMQDLAQGQTLSIQVQKKMANGSGSIVLFRDTRRGSASFQDVSVGCDNAFLPATTLTFEDTSAFSISRVPGEWYSSQNPMVRDVREMSNGSGLVNPPDGGDVFGTPNSTGDWQVNPVPTYHGLYEADGTVSSDSWEIRFTEGGSWAYSFSTDTLMGNVPVEAWNIGRRTPADNTDDQRVAVIIRDDNEDGLWTFGERIYLTNVPYVDAAPLRLDPSWKNLGYVRTALEDVSGALPIPARGTVIRLNVDYSWLSPPSMPPIGDPELQALRPSQPAAVPEGYDIGYRLQFTPKHSGNYISTVQVRDSTSGNLLATISLVGRTLPSCCEGTTGNVNGVGIVDLSDLSALVSYLTGGGYVLPCSDAANVNTVGIVDLSDLTALISFLTGFGYVLPPCP